MNTIDLHLHTYFSDGVSAPEEVVRRAKSAGYKTIAITDHDGTDGIERAQAEGRKLGINVIPGIEMFAEFEMPDVFSDSLDDIKYEMHILGLGIGPNSAPLRKQLESQMEKRNKRAIEYIRIFNELGYDISLDEVKNFTYSHTVWKTWIARLLVKKGIISDFHDAFSGGRFFDLPQIRAIPHENTEAMEAIDLINGAGGQAFLAHPYQLAYKGRRTDSEEVYMTRLEVVASALTAAGMTGIEAYYPTHSAKMTSYLISLADDLGLRVSRGSDDHGLEEPVKRMGDFQVVSDGSRLAWVEDLVGRKAR